MDAQLYSGENRELTQYPDFQPISSSFFALKVVGVKTGYGFQFCLKNKPGRYLTIQPAWKNAEKTAVTHVFGTTTDPESAAAFDEWAGRLAGWLARMSRTYLNSRRIVVEPPPGMRKFEIKNGTSHWEKH